MRNSKRLYTVVVLVAIAFLGLLPVQAAKKATTAAATPARMTVTLQVLGDNKRTPEVTSDDVVVWQGKQRLQVTGFTPAREGRGALDLFILIDDASHPSLGIQLDDLRAFINAQPRPLRWVWVTCGTEQFKSLRISQPTTAGRQRLCGCRSLPPALTGARTFP